ncbi:unnamed protein product [Mytilus edulis]|uniref:Tyr recombinase domain-containing protein n=1 Tax=Mytilus edulis TaxID=6550 RepID=A0A8S3TYC9_MYTED|nr:unnamed protein product [Mytilus edulis]
MSTSPVHNQQTGVTTAMERVTGPIIAQRDGGSNQPRPVALQEQSDETVKYNLSPFISHDQDFEFECSSASSFRVDNLRRNLDFWKYTLNANNFVLNVVEFGYLIPFTNCHHDGWGIESSFEDCVKLSKVVKHDLLSAGFFLNHEKSIWDPTKVLTWLGFRWHLDTFNLEIPEDKIKRFKATIDDIFSNINNVTARQLAKVTGKIISFIPSFGNICRIMSRNMLILIAASDYWDFHIQLTDEAIFELNFWKNNCTSLPRKSLTRFIFADRIVFTDASGFALCGFRFKHSHWESLRHFSNPDLKALTVSLCSVVTASKSENTLKKYKGYFKRFKYWCLKYNLPFLPTTVCTVALYLNYLIQSGVSTAVLNAAYYSIKWEHDLNLYDSILNDKLLDMVLEGGIRLLSKPLKRKEPITPTILKSIIAKFDKNDNLPGLRICAMMLLGFSGFLRYDELAHIRSSDLTFNDSHLQINIQKSKTDRYRQGNTILISRTGTDLCPVAMLQKYFRVANFLPLFGDPETTTYMTRVVTIYFYYILN